MRAEFFPARPPWSDDLVGRSIRDDERAECYILVVKSPFDVLDRGMEPYLGIAHPIDVSEALGISEDDVLLAFDEEPNDEVGMKIPCLEESNTPALAQVPKEIQFLSGKVIGAIVAE